MHALPTSLTAGRSQAGVETPCRSGLLRVLSLIFLPKWESLIMIDSKQPSPQELFLLLRVRLLAILSFTLCFVDGILTIIHLWFGSFFWRHELPVFAMWMTLCCVLRFSSCSSTEAKTKLMHRLGYGAVLIFLLHLTQVLWLMSGILCSQVSGGCYGRQ